MNASQTQRPELDARPRVSCAVVTYNQREYLDEAISGCISQLETYPNLEVVIADDGSTDGTVELARSWAQRHPEHVRLALSPVNRGIAANMTAAMDAATGALLAWLGGDDVMLPGKIMAQVELLVRHPEASGCYHDAEVFEWPSGKVLGKFSTLYGGKAFSTDKVDARRMLDPRYQMLPSTLLLRRDRMPDSLDSRFRFHNDYLFDFETIANGGPYVRMDGVLVRYRKHQRSIGKDPKVMRTLLEENLMVLAVLTARYPTLARAIQRREIYYLMLESLKAYQRGDRLRGRELARVLFAREAWIRGIGLWLFGPYVAILSDPKYRAVALKLRSKFA